MHTDSRCGRPKTDGEPCRNILNLFQVACRLHRIEADGALEGRLRDLWNSAYETGKRAGRSEVEWEARGRQREAERTASLRFQENGAQIVQVMGRYAYKWHGEPLDVDDEVLVPRNWLFHEPQWLTVTELGSDYQGELSSILRVRKIQAPLP